MSVARRIGRQVGVNSSTVTTVLSSSAICDQEVARYGAIEMKIDNVSSPFSYAGGSPLPGDARRVQRKAGLRSVSVGVPRVRWNALSTQDEFDCT
jgi:hypothetical protein